MVWFRQVTGHYLNWCWPSSVTSYRTYLLTLSYSVCDVLHNQPKLRVCMWISLTTSTPFSSPSHPKGSCPIYIYIYKWKINKSIFYISIYIVLRITNHSQGCVESIIFILWPSWSLRVWCIHSSLARIGPSSAHSSHPNYDIHLETDISLMHGD